MPLTASAATPGPAFKTFCAYLLKESPDAARVAREVVLWEQGLDLGSTGYLEDEELETLLQLIENPTEAHTLIELRKWFREIYAKLLSDPGTRPHDVLARSLAQDLLQEQRFRFLSRMNQTPTPLTMARAQQEIQNTSPSDTMPSHWIARPTQQIVHLMDRNWTQHRQVMTARSILAASKIFRPELEKWMDATLRSDQKIPDLCIILEEYWEVADSALFLWNEIPIHSTLRRKFQEKLRQELLIPNLLEKLKATLTVDGVLSPENAFYLKKTAEIVEQLELLLRVRLAV